MLGTVGVDPITLGFFAEDGDCFFFPWISANPLCFTEPLFHEKVRDKLACRRWLCILFHGILYPIAFLQSTVLLFDTPRGHW